MKEPWNWLAVLWFVFCGCREAQKAPAPTDNSPQPALRSMKAATPPWFEDVSATCGINFRHTSGHRDRFWMPEIESGGVGLIDFDNDGLLDVFFVNGGSLNPGEEKPSGHALFRNLGGWQFTEVTERAGLRGRNWYGMGSACADFDADGFVDILVTHVQGCLLFRNNHDGTFSDVTETAGITEGAWGTSACFFDYNGDGRLDLFVANYLRWNRETEINCFSRGGLPDYCSPLNYRAPARDTLYRNLGDGRFENVSVAAGLNQAFGNALGVTVSDFDQDGRLDVFVANDATPNQLWLNRSNGVFVDEAGIRGCAYNLTGSTRAGMGAVSVDLRQQGRFDVYVTHLVNEGNGVFENQGGIFFDRVAARGPQQASLSKTGFGVGFHDFDLDGNLDLYVANGRVRYGAVDLDPRDPYAEPDTLLRGVGGVDFEEVFPEGGTGASLLGTGRGAAFGDLDNDGRVDVVVVNKDGPPHVLRNIAPAPGHFIRLNLCDAAGRCVPNAVVRVEAAQRRWWRQALSNEGYCSSHDPRVHFGLGNTQRVEGVFVRWPDGAQESFGAKAVDQEYQLVRGRGLPLRGAFSW